MADEIKIIGMKKMENSIESMIPEEIDEFIPKEMQKDVLEIIINDDEVFGGENYEKKAQRAYSLARFYNMEKIKADSKNDEDSVQAAIKHAFAYFTIYTVSSRRAINEYEDTSERNRKREERKDNLKSFIKEFSNHSN